MVLQQTLPGLRLPDPVSPTRSRRSATAGAKPAAAARAADPTTSVDATPSDDPTPTDDATTVTVSSPGDGYTTLPSPLGAVFVAFSGERVCLLAPAGDAAEFESRFFERTGRRVTPVPEAPARLTAAVAAGDGSGLQFDLDRVTRFERAVLTATTRIPTGEVRPYAWIAATLGAPNTVRAVGGALRRNPVPLLIPCHRVVRSDGLIGEYAIGAAHKRQLLTAEGVDLEWLERLARARVRYMGTPSGHWCHPTCTRVRATPVEHQAPFQSTATATAAGYQPCEWCQPGAAQSRRR